MLSLIQVPSDADPAYVDIKGKDVAMIVGPAAVGLVIVVVIGLATLVSVARKKRSLHGTYSPQKQEFNAPRLELATIVKQSPIMLQRIH